MSIWNSIDEPVRALNADDDAANYRAEGEPTVGIDVAARWRTTDPGERAKAMMVAKPPPVPDGQVALFDDQEALR
jgi:hypothetical protein